MFVAISLDVESTLDTKHAVEIAWVVYAIDGSEKGTLLQQSQSLVKEVWTNENICPDNIGGIGKYRYYTESGIETKTLSQIGKEFGVMLLRFKPLWVHAHGLLMDKTTLKTTFENYKRGRDRIDQRLNFDTLQHADLILKKPSSSLCERLGIQPIEETTIQAEYRAFCEKWGFMTKERYPKPKTNLETVARFLLKNPYFLQSHTALQDAEIARLLMCFILKQFNQ